MADSEADLTALPPAPDGARATGALPPPKPDRIGPYRVLETLGQGGMGIVYLAEQDKPLRRRVAIKIIKVGMDTDEVVARFESERQALALMNHPNIAKVFDAGATLMGRPYFVMEHVPGVPITDYCDRHQLTTRERAELFIPICQAVQHAHQRGIIHRDLKPSNILVMVQDGKPVPKIIDFGVAKATEQRLTENTIFTQQGVLIGTPEYMSPEQAEMSGLGVDATTDIYSLGVILYELLVGALPFEARQLRQAGLAAIQRVIREVDPPKPSTRLSTLGDRVAEIARHRRTEPQLLSRQVRGELDWITMRALEKDRTRRYATALDFAADVLRHLDGRTVQARPLSVAYRIQKMLRRRRGLLPVAALVLVAIGFAGIARQQVEKERRRDQFRTILQEAVRLQETPTAIVSPSEWQKVAVDLNREVRSAPDGELARLTRRALTALKTDLPLYARVTDETVLRTTFNSPDSWLDPRFPYCCLAELEFSWDGGAWQPLGVRLLASQDRGFGYPGRGYRLWGFLNPAQLTARVHSLALRGRFLFYDRTSPATMSLLTDLDSLYAANLVPIKGDPRPEVEQLEAAQDRIMAEMTRRFRLIRPVMIESRDLGRLNITLYADYPADFPSQVQEPTPGETFARWFQVREIRLLQVVVPEGQTHRTVTFKVEPDAKCALNADLLSGLAPGETVAVGVQLRGEMSRNIPLPLAGSLKVLVGDSVVLELRLPIAFGPGDSRLGDCSTVQDTVVVDAAWALHPVAPNSYQDGDLRGQLQYTPSRLEARRTQRFTHYLGSVPPVQVLVRVQTITGRWSRH